MSISNSHLCKNKLSVFKDVTLLAHKAATLLKHVYLTKYSKIRNSENEGCLQDGTTGPTGAFALVGASRVIVDDNDYTAYIQ